MTEMVKLASLPRMLHEPTIDGCACDAMHLAELLDVMTARMHHLSGLTDEQKEARNSLAAFLWMAVDLVEVLKWKLNRIEEAQERVS